MKLKLKRKSKDFINQKNDGSLRACADLINDYEEFRKGKAPSWSMVYQSCVYFFMKGIFYAKTQSEVATTGDPAMPKLLSVFNKKKCGGGTRSGSLQKRLVIRR